MTSAELRRIVGAIPSCRPDEHLLAEVDDDASGRRWRFVCRCGRGGSWLDSQNLARGEHAVHRSDSLSRFPASLSADLSESGYRDDTVAAIVAIANHADALVRLVEAADALRTAWPEGGCVISPPCGDCDWCRFSAALDAVHAIKETP